MVSIEKTGVLPYVYQIPCLELPPLPHVIKVRPVEECMGLKKDTEDLIEARNQSLTQQIEDATKDNVRRIKNLKDQNCFEDAEYCYALAINQNSEVNLPHNKQASYICGSRDLFTDETFIDREEIEKSAEEKNMFASYESSFNEDLIYLLVRGMQERELGEWESAVPCEVALEKIYKNEAIDLSDKMWKEAVENAKADL